MIRGVPSALRSGAWLTRERATAYLVILVIANVFGLSLAMCHAHGWLMPAEAHFSTEFMGFYAAGKLIDHGGASLVYAPGMPVHAYIESQNLAPAHVEMQRALSGDPQLAVFASFYPPVFWLICAPLARLPYYVAFVLWVAASLAFFLFALRAVVFDRSSAPRSWLQLWPAAAYLGFYENAGVGENSFLSAGLLGFGLVELEKRPVLAGLLFGSLAYKPHFALPVGILLIAGRHWRALAAAAFSGSTLCILAGAVFGWQRWYEYFGIVAPHAQWMLRHDGFSYAIQVTTYAAVRLVHGPIWLADGAQILTAIFAATAVFIASRRGKDDVRGAVLATSFPLMLSVMLDYDLTICGLAIPFFYRAIQRTGALPWEKTALAGMFALPVMTFALRYRWHLPVDTLLLIGIMTVLLARIRTERRIAPKLEPT